MPSLPSSSIGIVGGGQLALMLAEAAAELGVALHVQTPHQDDPATARAASLLLAPLDDAEATRRLARDCGAISFENEWIPFSRLQPLVDEGVTFVPALDALVPLLSKRGQRELLNRLHLPCPRWCGLEAVLTPPSSATAGASSASSSAAGSYQASRPEASSPADRTPGAPATAASAPQGGSGAAAGDSPDADGMAGRWGQAASLDAGGPPLAPPPFAADSAGPLGASWPPSSLGRGGEPFQPRQGGRGPTLPPGFQFPLMAKASRGGYDGKGTVPIADASSLATLLEHVLPSEWILEEMVAFEQELALVACRDQEGTVACFPLVQTHQVRQVCDWVLMPAPVNHAVASFARNVAASLLTALDYVGVMAIEFFYGPAGLQVNELAPRTHNSGHLTIEACRCSQFSQQVRLVAGLPMGSTEAVVPGALMVNLLGTDPVPTPEQERARLDALAALPGAHLHWYGKAASAPGRKLGHLTIVLAATRPAERLQERDRLLEQVRRIWPLPQGPASEETA